MGPSLYTFKGPVYGRVADADVRVKSDAQNYLDDGSQVELLLGTNRVSLDD